MMKRKNILLIDTDEAKKLFSASRMSLQELKKIDKGIKEKISEGHVVGGYDILNIIDKLRSFSRDFDVAFYKEMFVAYLERVESSTDFVSRLMEDKKELINNVFTNDEKNQINNIILTKKEKERVDFDHV